MQRIDPDRFDDDSAGDPAGSIFGLPLSEDESNVVLVPVPWEATTSYGRGTALGPAAIRAASPQLDLFDPALAELGLSNPWKYGIFMRPEELQLRKYNELACARAAPIIARGGEIGGDPRLRASLEEVNATSELVDAWVRAEVGRAIDADKIVGVVGGDHSVAFGAIAAHAARWPGLGVLHVDAHADLRVAYEGFTRSHASVLGNVLDLVDDVGALVQVGIRDLSARERARARADDRVVTHYDFAMQRWLFEGKSFATWCDEVIRSLPSHVYVTFDIDGLDPALCPSTGTPVPGGLSFALAEGLLLALARSGRTVVGFDLVEVAPSGRPGDEWDANVGARILYRLCGLSLVTRGATD
jgi:agmatinase